MKPSWTERYKVWLNEEVEDYWGSIAPNMDKLTYLESACWFVTITFKRHHINMRQAALDLAKQDTKLQADDFDFLYRKIALATNPSKTGGKFPFALMGLDFEGSRGQVSTFTNLNVHCHAVICSPLEHVNIVERYVRGPRFRITVLPLTSIDGVHFVRYDRSKDKDETLTTYVTKATIKSERSPSGTDEMRIYRGHEDHFDLGAYERKRTPKRENRLMTRLHDRVRHLRAKQTNDAYAHSTNVDAISDGDLDWNMSINDVDFKPETGDVDWLIGKDEGDQQ